ncbi:albusnodin family lasso peptide [Nocardiopsis sp. FIRDI 009]|nr:albusnodin family lasso peptide [Nocardiopsis sp. FIRDI 009]
MDDRTDGEEIMLGDVADLTLGEGSDDNEDKRQVYC